MSSGLWSPARIPDWEREEGNRVYGARPHAVALSSRQMSSHATMSCSFYKKIFEQSKCSWWRSQQYQPGIFLDDPLLERTSFQWVHARKLGQCTPGFRSVDRIHYVHIVYAYLPLRINTLHICFCVPLLSRSSQLANPGWSLPSGTADGPLLQGREGLPRRAFSQHPLPLNRRNDEKMIRKCCYWCRG